MMLASSAHAMLAAHRRAGVLRDSLPVQMDLDAALRDGRHVAVMAPRRSGKTEGVLRCLLRRAWERPMRVAWIEDYGQTAWETVLPLASDLADRYGLRMRADGIHHRATIGQLTISCFGARQERFVAQLRGKKWDYVIIDEAQRLWDADLASHLSRIILPSLADRRGSIILAGTPGDAAVGQFAAVVRHHGAIETASDGDVAADGDDDPTERAIAAGFVLVRAKPFANPATADGLRAQLAALRAADPEIESEGWVQREYYGRWVPDDRGAVVRVPDHALLRRWSPAGPVVTIVGVDYGYDPDPCAFVTLQVDVRERKAAFLGGYIAGRLLDHEVASHVDSHRQRYGAIEVVMDPGGGGKSTIGALQRTHGVRAKEAEKWDKQSAVRSLRDDLATGRCGLYHESDPDHPRAHPLARQWAQLMWVWRGRVRSEGEPRHLHDAALYAWREAKRYITQIPEQKQELTGAERREAYALRKQRGRYGARP